MKSLNSFFKKPRSFNLQRCFAPRRAKAGVLVFAITFLLLLTGTAQQFNIFGLTNVWKYSTDCHDGDNWQTPGYDDSSWLSGPGGFTGGETSAAILPILNTRTLPAPGSASQI